MTGSKGHKLILLTRLTLALVKVETSFVDLGGMSLTKSLHAYVFGSGIKLINILICKTYSRAILVRDVSPKSMGLVSKNRI